MNIRDQVEKFIIYYFLQNIINLKKLIIFILGLSCWSIIFGNLLIYLQTSKLLSNQEDFLNDYNQNYEYLVNNNLAQYSSYIIIDKNDQNDTIYTIEVFVQLNVKRVKKYGSMDNFTFVIKFLGNKHHLEEIVELKPTFSPVFHWNYNMKFILNFTYPYKRFFYINRMLVAVIWKYDFDKNLDIYNFTKTLNISEAPNQTTLPYSLIKFQRPTIINVMQPRLPSVSFCIHYTYEIPAQIFNWIDFHFSFGVNEIMIYDPLNDKSLTKILRDKYGNDKRLTILPYNITIDDICSYRALFKQYKQIILSDKLKDFLNKSCHEYYKTKFSERVTERRHHEQLTVNDCLTVLNKKHEFIGYYDLDEFVFPRSFDSIKDFYEKKSSYTCDKRKLICALHPFTNRFKPKRLDASKRNYYYNYLNSIIEKNLNKRDINNLGSIRFLHASVIIPNSAEKRLMNELKNIIERIDKNKKNLTSLLFPLGIYLSEPPFKNGHVFEIQKEDIDYIKYLYKIYKGFIPCAYQKYLNKTNKLDPSMVRYLYYVTEFVERWPKEIHYYKHVKSIYNHWALDKDNKAWSFTPSATDGHFLPHFRKNIDVIWTNFRNNFTSSIRNLNFDFEYMFYLLKHYTNFCEI